MNTDPNLNTDKNLLSTQEKKFLTGNEMVAEAARAIDFHFMGFYPITPSTEIAERINAMKANGEVSTVMLAADGEHGAAGACFGAATAAGARVLNATSANGFLYSLEQLPVQAGSRLPMVLNLVTRSVSGPLNIRCDHSDLAFALQTGWIILLAPTPQAVYDLNILAVKLGEHPRVRLPVMVVSDGFFTSHQRQSVQIFKDVGVVRKFLGQPANTPTSLDPRHPITIGPYMNDHDLINNKFQLHQAHLSAAEVYEEITADYKKLCGRHYPALQEYKMEEAETGLFLLNSASETSKDAVDRARSEGKKVGLLTPHLLRPFPGKQIKQACQNLKSLVVGERADTPGSEGGPISHEIFTAIFSATNLATPLKTEAHEKNEDPLKTEAPIKILSRIYGLGGKDFNEKDADAFISEGFETLTKNVPFFRFHGIAAEGNKQNISFTHAPFLTKAEVSPRLVQIEELTPATGASQKHFLRVQIAELNQLAMKQKRIAPGHGACPGCGIFSGLDQFFKGIEGDVVVLYHTGCAMVTTTDYPFSAHRVTYLHNLFQNGAPTLSGLVETFQELKRRQQIPITEDLTFIMITGDGGMDIGMGPTIGTALRNHKMIILEYDNQGYMNTGGQLSYTTPLGKSTSTSQLGKESFGKTFHHKDTASIMAATGIPYVFTAIESTETDLIEKAAKAQWYARHRGLAFGKILVSCPLNWSTEEKLGQQVLQKAVDCCFFPVFEIERGLTRLSYDPEKTQKKIPVKDWLEMMGKSKHLLLPQNAKALEHLQQEVDRRWLRLKAMSDHPLL